MRAMLFPGQGAQFAGMGKDFYDASPAAREIFDRADEALGFALKDVIFGGPEEKLAETDHCQPAILTCSAAIIAAMRDAGALRDDDFQATAGLSLGEYTALWFSGSIDFDDAVRLVRTRGQAMQEASERAPSAMASLLGADGEKAEEVCQACAEGDVLVAANFLGSNVAVSGAVAAIDRVVERAKEFGIRRAVRLKVAGAFHSPLMEPAASRLAEALEGVEIRAPKIPVISNVTAQAHPASPGEIRAALVQQVTSPVLWEASMRMLLDQGLRAIVEPGPGSVLCGLMKSIDRSVERENVADASCLDRQAEQRGNA